MLFSPLPSRTELQHGTQLASSLRWLTSYAPPGFLGIPSHLNSLFSTLVAELASGELRHVYLLPGLTDLASSLDCEILKDRDHLTHLCIFRPSTVPGT